MKLSEMKKLLKENNISIPRNAKKEELAAIIEEKGIIAVNTEPVVASEEAPIIEEPQEVQSDEEAPILVTSSSRRVQEDDITDVKTVYNFRTGKKVQKYFNKHGDVVRMVEI